MGLRIAILLAVIGGLALIGAIAFFAVPNRRGPRVAVISAVAALLIVATLAIFLAPISGVTQAPVSPNLSLYLTGQICDSAPPLFNSSCGSGPQALLNLRATDGAVRWSAPAGAAQDKVNTAFLGVPILRDGVLYTTRGGAAPGDPAATLLALRASDGGEIWRAALESTPLSMQVADGQVFVLLKYQENASLVRVYNASNGVAARQFALPIFGDFTVADGLIIACYTYLFSAGSTSASFVAYHASDGSLVWSEILPVGAQAGPSAVPCSLTVGDGVIYSAPYQGDTVSAIHLANGEPLWTAPVGFVAALRLSKDHLIAVSAPSPYAAKFGQPNPASEKVMALGLADGQTVWQREFAIGPLNGPYSAGFIAMDEERLYVSTTSALRSLRLSDGATLWERKSSQNQGQFYLNPVVAQKTVFVGYGYSYGFAPGPLIRTPQSEQIYALNAATGEPYWNVPVYSTGFLVGEV
jgi:outer membrane protein assembly factor BamB